MLTTMGLKLIVILVLCGNCIGKESEIFSSTTELERLYQLESEVVKKLDEYATMMDNNLQIIKKYIEDFNKVRMNDASEVVANPFTAFHILKRTVVDWEIVADTIKHNHTIATGIIGDVIKTSEQLPTFEDFIGGSMALVGLQDTYALNLTDLMYGKFSTDNKVPGSPYELSARDLLFLGKAAFNKGLYDRSINWLEMALTRCAEEAQDPTKFTPTATREEIIPFLETTKRVHDEVLEKRGPGGENWQTFSKPVNKALSKNRKYDSVKAYKPIIYKPLLPHEENENYKALCQGVQLRTPRKDAQLRCRYLGRKNTRSYIGPFKIEEHSLDPFVMTIKNFMSDAEMASFRDTASNRLKRSLHHGKNGNYVATDIRISKQAWLSQSDGPFVNIINRRISDATGLLTFPENISSEVFQVANYGMAGRYNPHTDYITGEDQFRNPTEVLRGNRIATLMVYLENVTAGGSTVFPFIGVQVKPKKGMAVFWWNLKKDGTGDPLTRHAGCSVLYGNKWIANKWIRYNNQFQKIPCPLESEDNKSCFGLPT